MEQNVARPASTIVVIREQNAVLEILMLRRSTEVAAASGAHVFAGGAVDQVDHDVVRRGLVAGLEATTAARRLGLAAGARAYYCAALRELFEEAGLLVAVDARGRPLGATHDRLDAWREELVTRRVRWPELLEREGLRLALGQMQYLAHWVTPERRRRRFDTRFFVARAPVGQAARADGSEITELVWTSAATALAHVDAARWTMLVPTVRTLRLLAPMASVDEVMTYATTTVVRRTQPREIERDGQLVVVVPGDPDYDEQQ